MEIRYRHSYYSYLIDGIVLLGWLPNLERKTGVQTICDGVFVPGWSLFGFAMC